MTARDEARRFFDAIAGRYDRVYAPDRTSSRARMTRVLAALPGPCRALDLGVGTGRELSALLDEGHTITGLDVSPEMLARCARRARPIPTVLADLWSQLPFEPRTFDAVLALHGTLAHPPAKSALEGFASESARVLVPGGRLVIEVPLPGWLDTAGQGDEERRVELLEPGRATFIDAATCARIEAQLFPVTTWREALDPGFVVSAAAEERGELFLVARRRDD